MNYELVKIHLAELVQIASDEVSRFEIHACHNRLSRILFYRKLMTLLSQNNHSQHVLKLGSYVSYEEKMIQAVLNKYSIATELSKFPTIECELKLQNLEKKLSHLPHHDVLVLMSDLFRDFDDWLSLVNAILINKYREIIIVTSNEVNGECAKVIASIVPELQKMCFDLHHKAIEISVYQGLESFDFAGGIHEPPKTYSAAMRMPALMSDSTTPNSFENLYNKLRNLKNAKRLIDLVSIGKVADHDMVWIVMDALNYIPNRDITLGSRPQNVKGTNTNHPVHHLEHLLNGAIMLDSRYGAGNPVNRKKFAKIIEAIESSSPQQILGLLSQMDMTQLNHAEKYFLGLSVELYKAACYSNATQIIANLTFKHLADQQYDTPSIFDLFAMITALFPNVAQLKAERIAFYTDKTTSERPLCSTLASLPDAIVPLKTVEFLYPNIESLNKFIFNELNNIISRSIQMSFRNTLISLPPQSKKFLQYYGDWSNSSEERSRLSTTATDEYASIRRSLYLMLIVMKHETVDAIILDLAKDYQEENFAYSGLTLNASNEKNIKDNIIAIVKLRDDLRKQWGHACDQRLIDAFLQHDLGKSIHFIRDNQLCPAGTIVSSASNEFYLQKWFEQSANCKALEDQQTAKKWIDIFDGLGHNPAKLCTAGYTGLLTGIDVLLDTFDTKADNSIEVFNRFLFNKSLEFNLNIPDFQFLIADVTKNLAWTNLSAEQQNKVAMLTLCCPFIFVKPPLNTKQITSDFIREWKDEANVEIVSKITAFIVTNIESKHPVWLYNLTGLIHHKAEQGGSHFANNGTIKELFTVLFPFILKAVKGELPTINVEKEVPRTFNKFQLLQGVEVTRTMIPCLIENTTANLNAIDFASGPVKNQYLAKLEAAHSPLVAVGKRSGSPIHRDIVKTTVLEKEVVVANKASL